MPQLPSQNHRLPTSPFLPPEILSLSHRRPLRYWQNRGLERRTALRLLPPRRLRGQGGSHHQPQGVRRLQPAPHHPPAAPGQGEGGPRQGRSPPTTGGGHRVIEGTLAKVFGTRINTD